MSCRNNFFVCVLILSLACLLNEVYADSFWIDCGSPHNTTFGDRTFMGDSYASKYLVTPVSILANTHASTNLQMYQTARIFNGTTRYKFPLNQMGRYIIRLYFFPFNYNGYNLSTAKFLVSAQQFVLLDNYTPTSETMKEYSFKVFSKYLEIIIEPAVNFVAFLNALEVFLVPSVLIKDDATLINPRKAYKGLQIVVLETVFRVNMGGPTVGSNNDTLWRTWKSDVSYLEHNNLAAKAKSSTAIQYRSGRATRDVAPTTIYGTCRRLNTQNYPNAIFNVTWNFELDIGFQYLIRFHFCDIVSESPNELYFNVFVDSWIVSRMLDLTTLANGFLHAPIYVDFVTPIITLNKLYVSIAPPIAHVNNPDAILNGLEIMKMSNSRNTLDEGDSLPSFKKGAKNQVGTITRVTVVVVVSFFILVVILFLLGINCNRRLPQGHSTTLIPLASIGETSRTLDGDNSTISVTNVASTVGHRIPFAVVQEASNNFDENLAIGIGSFGKVYKGILADGTNVAIKRGHARSQQSLTAFHTEIELLSQFRHRHLVSLIGYCDENSENILIYEHMENGTLKSHLYGSNCSRLSWKQRLEICIGAARGLHYLHTGSTTLVIHRDVKSSNILLDENFMAKVADFGLSKIRTNLDQDHVSTVVKGSFGYLDPEYFRTQRITNKSDVYSFGVVLFEVLCARAVIDPTLQQEMINLVQWALEWQKKGQLENIIDPSLHGNIKPESLRVYGEIAEKCVANNGVERPLMNDVLCNLEYALQLQEATNPVDPQEQGLHVVDDTSGEATTSAHYSATIDDDLPSGSMSKVFSDLLKSDNQ